MTKFDGQAAVLIILSREDGAPKILLTKRTEGLRHHPGEVALPGGMWESEDDSLLDTALRESHEEVGLHAMHVSISGELPPTKTRKGVLVHAYIAHAQSDLAYLAPDKQEIASLKWVDIQHFTNDSRVQTDIFVVNGQEFWAPVYQVNDYRVWGFTARLLVNYVNTFHGSSITRSHKAKEVVFGLS